MSKEIKTPFGEFQIICTKCGSKNIDLKNSLGYSETIGAWGSLDIICVDCGYYLEIYSS